MRIKAVSSLVGGEVLAEPILTEKNDILIPNGTFEIIANDIVHDINDMPYDVIVDIKECNSDLYEHTVMVTLLSVLVARKLKLDEKRKYNIAVGCLLHDIGLRFIVTRYKNRDFSNANPAELFEYFL